MAGSHPVIWTLPNQPCSGLEESDKDIPLQLDGGVYKKTVNNSRVVAKLIAVQRADKGKTPTECTIEYMGMLRFAMPDNVSLSSADIGKGILGAASGAIKLVAYESDVATNAATAAKYNADLNGRVFDFSNETGNKWVDVLMPSS